MRKCYYAYHIGDVLYEVTPYPNETIVEHKIIDIYADYINHANVVIHFVTDHDDCTIHRLLEMFDTRKEAEDEIQRLAVLKDIVADIGRRDAEFRCM